MLHFYYVHIDVFSHDSWPVIFSLYISELHSILITIYLFNDSSWPTILRGQHCVWTMTLKFFWNATENWTTFSCTYIKLYLRRASDQSKPFSVLLQYALYKETDKTSFRVRSFAEQANPISVLGEGRKSANQMLKSNSLMSLTYFKHNRY